MKYRVTIDSDLRAGFECEVNASTLRACIGRALAGALGTKAPQRIEIIAEKIKTESIVEISEGVAPAVAEAEGQ